MKRLDKIEAPVHVYKKPLWFNRLQQKVVLIKQAQADNSVELDVFMPSILDKAFRGELL